MCRGPIPAGAGEPNGDVGRGDLIEAYPRGCGGTTGGIDLQPERVGLSPRVRGNRPWRSRGADWSRPIPAGAGEPARTRRPRGRRKAYPRGCGGTTVRYRGVDDGTGLSPRVRGNHRRNEALDCWVRPIPAGAGEPSPARQTRAGCRAYPRGCGGTFAGATNPRRVQGLSPRVRGNLDHHSHARYGGRPIPAGAGEPTRCVGPCLV